MTTRNERTIVRKELKQIGTKRKKLRTHALIFVCTLILGSGFFLAARLHFSSMDYGMKNSRLRKQVDQLEAEKRRLILAKETSLSPTEIKKAVKRASSLDAERSEAQIAQLASANKEKVEAAGPKPLVVKTVAVSAVVPNAEVSYKKSEKSNKEMKRVLAAE